MADEKNVMKVEVEEIPTDEELKAQEKTKEDVDITEEMRTLGRQVGETIRTAWESEERQRFESEVREGVQSFMSELNKALGEMRDSETAQKVKEEAGEIRGKVAAKDITHRAMGGLGNGLHWLSVELGKLADSFTPVEKGPEDVEPVDVAQESDISGGEDMPQK